MPKNINSKKLVSLLNKTFQNSMYMVLNIMAFNFQLQIMLMQLETCYVPGNVWKITTKCGWCRHPHI